MINGQIISEVNSVFRTLKSKYDDLTPALEMVSALIDRAISANFDERGRWDGNESDITIFSGGTQKWKGTALTKKKELKPVIQIPARPFITLTEDDLEEILETIIKISISY